MILLIVILIALSLWGIVATIVNLRSDGYRRLPTDWSRVVEHSDRR